MGDKHVRNCYDKTVPIYILPSVLEFSSLLPMALHSGLYRKWFKPFKSDLEFGQFIAKCFVPRHQPRKMSAAQLVETIHLLNYRIRRQVIQEHQELALEPLGINLTINNNIKDLRFYALQPLSQAITVTLRVDDFDIGELDMGKMPVLLTVTGVDSGLSEPLSLESVKDKATSILSDIVIEVLLEVAIDFVLDLEKRELAMFGLRPNPATTTASYHYGCGICDPRHPASMRLIGWRGPIERSSSRWVDTGRYAIRIGKSANLDRDLYEEEFKERSRLLTEQGMVRAEEMVDTLLK
ncbi:hypothetical protein FHETE_5975 [Fusarium heterosporum]|uniref:Uncharacterized protein n=1 Tax=Fusarium heterosporum TaxID=42747 RepID=A0A8H5TCV9_FUSHE|nr:hypothetical protein FHETE_5975 [Fusarium heterosporum]